MIGRWVCGWLQRTVLMQWLVLIVRAVVRVMVVCASVDVRDCASLPAGAAPSCCC